MKNVWPFGKEGRLAWSYLGDIGRGTSSWWSLLDADTATLYLPGFSFVSLPQPSDLYASQTLWIGHYLQCAWGVCRGGSRNSGKGAGAYNGGLGADDLKGTFSAFRFIIFIEHTSLPYTWRGHWSLTPVTRITSVLPIICEVVYIHLSANSQ